MDMLPLASQVSKGALPPSRKATDSGDAGEEVVESDVLNAGSEAKSSGPRVQLPKVCGGAAKAPILRAEGARSDVLSMASQVSNTV